MPTTYAIPNGRTVMDATLYTGNGATQTVINSDLGTVGFKPDLVWVKGRSTATQDHTLVDSVRGVSKALRSNSTAAELSEPGFDVTAFNTNGFTVVDNAAGGYNVNGSVGGTYSGAAQYVAWQWQAGQGTTSNNTSGTITSTVSANTTAGFSIVTYTGTGANATVGHGLSTAPQFIVVKTRNTTSDWLVYHIGETSASYYLLLNAVQGQTNNSIVWQGVTPTSSVFSIGTAGGTNANGNTFVAYCWAAVPGFSQFGSYTGNGSADGPFIYTSFQPKMILIKRTDTTGNWIMWDTARNTYNVMGEELYPNLSNAGSTATDMDVLSNGFKLRNTTADFNANGGTYIYACWASNPFKFSNAR